MRPLALPPVLPSGLLTYILTYQNHPTTLLICQSRANFLSSLLQCIPQYMPVQPPPPPEDLPQDTIPPLPEPHKRHNLVIPTLYQIATSRYINLVFIPSISHLRAYLAVFPPKAEDAPLETDYEKSRKGKPVIVVYGMVELHRDTSEWSAQGLSNTFAGLVEAGWRNRREIVLLEERKLDDGDEGDYGDELVEERGERMRRERLSIWDENVPMLNRSVRRAGIDGEDAGWSGRTVEIGRILGRWFRFGKEE